MTKTFLDTNILIYSQDKGHSDKQKLAENIISNAESAGCTIIYSEDLDSGQFYSGIQVVNPFLL